MQPITVSVSDAVKLSSLSPATLYRLIASQRLATVLVGRRRLILVASLSNLIGA